MRYDPKKYAKNTARSLTLISLFFVTLFMAQFIGRNEVVQEFVASFGYVGIFATAIISGFNVIVPIHAATFTPLFVAAGFPLPGIIICLVLGITISDLVSFWVGVTGKHFAHEKYGKQLMRLEAMTARKWWLPIAFLFAWSIIAPVPNELILIPLAVIGVPFRRVIIPLLAGNTIHMTLVIYGVIKIFHFGAV